jgi:2-deoxy-D-gluconate 3-dehydrogenase
MDVSTKKVIVIGSSGGIGYKTAEILLNEGYEVLGTIHKDSQETSDLKQNTNYSEKTLDLSDIQAIKVFCNDIKAESLYAIVNCAGIVKFEGDSTDEDIEIWNETIAINLSSNFYLAKLLNKNIVAGGRFIMISSTDSYYGGSVTASYSASKAGVNSLTKSLSLLFRDKKIRVNTIAPGWVSTPMIEGNSDEFYAKLAETNPLGRIANSEDIAKAIKFLLSKDSDYINGQVITVDGGYTNQDPTLLIEEEEVK